MEPIIEIRKLGKRYDIAHQRGGYVALRDVLVNVLRRPFAFLKTKAKRAAGLGQSEAFWALKDISFDVMPGEVIGIIGKNGAGKSTLLKILTGITPPSEGEIIMHGRVSSLLEVGTGFHPELTGRENIFLNGAILGMTRKEIVRKFDEIVAFSGVERFLDTPVKHYSSGMQVRLAFSVAAHLEPDILLVDEVLAVGDAEFQKKSMGKMEEVTRMAGRTILFVSHNMAAIQSLCRRSVLLEKGRIVKIGPTNEIINEYLHSAAADSAPAKEHRLPLTVSGKRGEMVFAGLSITDKGGSSLIHSDSKLRISLPYRSDFTEKIPDIRVLISIYSERSQTLVLRLDSHVVEDSLDASIAPHGEIVCETDPIGLVDGHYRADVLILPQTAPNTRLPFMGMFEVVTDLSRYGYRLRPDKTVSDRVIRYRFRQ